MSALFHPRASFSRMNQKNMWRWDIFCKVVDNYGDIGTCWRLAQQLAEEHQAEVRLWVDELQSFGQLCPAVSAEAEQQRVGRIEIRRWRADFPDVEAADVVIEAFACELPESYMAAMVRRAEEGEKHVLPERSGASAAQDESAPGSFPVWINLEYLSAEPWVEGCHRLPSLRTKWPLTKYFFFPGFTPQTGGLLRERGLLGDRAAFDSAAEAEFWRSVGVPSRRDGELRVSLFCYENPALPDLLRCWADGQDAVTVLAMPGPAADQVAGWFGEPMLPGTPLRRSSLAVYALPFLPQPSFDRLLWSCDVNFVRGEDSFVRAQWAGQPFVWHIYPQAEEAHLVKLEAFLSRYLDGFEGAEAVRGCWQAWNGRGNIASAWPAFVANREAIMQHGKVWASILDQMGNLANNLVCFIRGI
jgi:uncharacterized repeat protein (TIGR03837 family)